MLTHCSDELIITNYSKHTTFSCKEAIFAIDSQPEVFEYIENAYEAVEANGITFFRLFFF